MTANIAILHIFETVIKKSCFTCMNIKKIFLKILLSILFFNLSNAIQHSEFGRFFFIILKGIDEIICTIC